MIYPRPWWYPDGWGTGKIGCGVLDLPHTEFEDVLHKKPDCMNFW